jgi:hypothetical protein
MQKELVPKEVIIENVVKETREKLKEIGKQLPFYISIVSAEWTDEGIIIHFNSSPKQK